MSTPAAFETSSARSAPRFFARRLFGRERELASLEAAFAGAAAGKSQVVLIAGEAGIGKSALVDAFAARERSSGARVLQGECRELEASRPFGPFVEMLRAALTLFPKDAEQALLSGATELRRFLPEWTPRGIDARAGTIEPFRSHESFAALFLALARQAPLALAIEDLHFADAATLELMWYLSRRLRAASILLVATYRTDALRRHPLGSVLAELERTSRVLKLDLRPLGTAEVGLMIESALGGRALENRFRRALCEVCEGNPFFVEEVLATLERGAGVPSPDGGSRRESDVRELLIPESVRASVDQRLEALGAETRRTLQLAAVIGRDFEFDVLQRVSTLPERRLLDALSGALDAQLIVEAPDAGGDRFRFRHALTREAILVRLLRRERRALHRSVAEAIEETAGDRVEPQVRVLAYHFDEAGENERALRYHALAADDAERVLAFSDAVLHLERACALASPQLPALASLHARLARAALLAQEPRRAFEAASKARVLYEAARDTAGAASALTRMAWCQAELGDQQAGATLALSAIAAAEPLGSCTELAEAHEAAMVMLGLDGKPQAAEQHARTALDMARRCGDARVEVVASCTLSRNRSFDGCADEAIGLARDAVQFAVAHGLVTDAHHAFIALVTALQDAGAKRFEVRAAYDQWFQHNAQRGYWHELARDHEICLAFADGDWDRALRLTEEMHDTAWNLEPRLLAAFMIGAREGPRESLASAAELRGEFLAHRQPQAIMALSNVAALYWLSDDARLTLESARPIAEFLASPERRNHLTPWSRLPLGPIAVLALAAAEALGDDAAITYWTELMTRDRDGPEPRGQAGGRAFAAGRRASRDRDLDRALVLLAEAAEHLEQAELPIGVTVARLERADILVRRGRPGDRNDAAMEVAAIVPYWRAARATWYLAKLRRWARAHRLPLREPVTLDEGSHRDSAPSVLTARESEVAALVAEGLTNAAISRRLTISERTAEAHVEHIRNKLGFHSRVQIGAWVAGALVVDATRDRSFTARGRAATRS